jgi:hypothetical protein
MAESDFGESQATRFARLALDCVHKEYPNKIAHSLNSDAGVKPPRERPRVALSVGMPALFQRLPQRPQPRFILAPTLQ